MIKVTWKKQRKTTQCLTASEYVTRVSLEAQRLRASERGGCGSRNLEKI